LEQDADVVILLHRDDKARPGEMEIQVAKQRNGPAGVATLAFMGHYARLANLARWEYAA
jgi:replicative DNA helicase